MSGMRKQGELAINTGQREPERERSEKRPEWVQGNTGFDWEMR